MPRLSMAYQTLEDLVRDLAKRYGFAAQSTDNVVRLRAGHLVVCRLLG